MENPASCGVSSRGCDALWLAVSSAGDGDMAWLSDWGGGGGVLAVAAASRVWGLSKGARGGPAADLGGEAIGSVPGMLAK